VVHRWGSLVLIASLLGLGGCLGTPLPGQPDHNPPEEAIVIVALVDSGINVYHRDFQDPAAISLPSRLSALPIIPVDLSFGPDYESSRAADSTFWNSLESGQLYWFRGTRILAASMQDPSAGQEMLDTVPHGTGAVATIMGHAPASWVLMVTAGTVPLPETNFAYTAEAVRWLGKQPWIDAISLSLGLPFHLRDSNLEEVVAATRSATANGKIVVASIGNDPTPGVTSQFAGPPWVVSAGGVENGTKGESTLASKGPDFVSDYAVQAPCGEHVTDYCEYIGTSFSTPMVAGAFARAIHDLRVATGHQGGIQDGALVKASGLRVTNHDLREAFNRTATYWATTDYQPRPPPLDDPILAPFRVTHPIGPAPWTQMGWGYVGHEHGPLVADLLFHGQPLPEKPPEAVRHMEAQQAAREAYWGQQG
jgi:hypothetical protein